MKSLTYAESEAWFAANGITIGDHRNILFSKRSTRRRGIFISDLKLDVTRLASLSTQLVDWLPNVCERMLWLTSWETYPPDQTILFETVRRGCQEYRRIIEVPGHLFQSSQYDRNDYDTRTTLDHEENALMWGLFLLMIILNWDGYLVTQNTDYIALGDNSLIISSTEDNRLTEAYDLVNRFNLKFREQSA